MNLVAGVTTFPVLVRFDTSLARSEDAVHRMESVGQGNLAAVLTRNLAISRGLRVVDALLLMLHVREVWNFELWEQARAAERVPAQNRSGGEEQDCFGMSVVM